MSVEHRSATRVRSHGACLATLACLLGCLTSCDSGGPFDGDRAYRHAAAIVGKGPRPPGSAGLRAVEEYIRAELTALGLEPQVQAFRAPADVKAPDIEFRNVWVEIPGADPAGPILALGAHYDSKIAHGHADPAHNFEFVGALDAAGSCGVLLELARVLVAERRVQTNVWLIWFDGEESLDWEWGDGARALIGSTHFVATMSQDKQRFPKGFSQRLKTFVLLDLLGDKNQKIDRDTMSHAKLLEIFAAAAAEHGAADRMYRWESPMTDDHVPFKNHGVKVIDLIDFRWRVPEHHRGDVPAEARQYTAWWHTPLDTLDNLSADSLDFVGELLWTALPRIETEFYR